MTDRRDAAARRHFDSLTEEQKRQAIHRLRAEGYSPHGIAAATGIAVEQVQLVLAEREAA
jgi:hypothetical protein